MSIWLWHCCDSNSNFLILSEYSLIYHTAPTWNPSHCPDSLMVRLQRVQGSLCLIGGKQYLTMSFPPERHDHLHKLAVASGSTAKPGTPASPPDPNPSQPLQCSHSPEHTCFLFVFNQPYLFKWPILSYCFAIFSSNSSEQYVMLSFLSMTFLFSPRFWFCIALFTWLLDLCMFLATIPPVNLDF